VQGRLSREVTYWDHRAAELDLQASAGKTPRMNPDRAAARADDLQRRKAARLAELDRQAQLASQPPIIVGAALIIPALLLDMFGQATAPPAHALDTTVVERRAVDAVLAVEAAFGHQAVEMAHNHPGYDVRSTRGDGTVTFIEVKGRIAGADSFTVTQNELRFAANVPNDYMLAMVEVSPEKPGSDRVAYLRRPYGPEVRLPFDTTATTLAWAPYWTRATPAAGPSCRQN